MNGDYVPRLSPLLCRGNQASANCPGSRIDRAAFGYSTGFVEGRRYQFASPVTFSSMCNGRKVDWLMDGV